jgi:branched-subunit amino acid aminotransferase/4-amino-4-deoxychorismate lyase
VYRAEVNGRPATAEQLTVPAVMNYGHFTSMQVRDGSVRGLDAHLHRLSEGTRTLFGTELDAAAVREYLRHAVAGEEAVTARVTILARPPWSDVTAPAEPDVLVTLRAPSAAGGGAVRLRSVRYERELPEVKHVGTFGLIQHARAAKLAGFDDALFVTSTAGRDCLVSEASIWNVGFFDGSSLLWPRAPMLDGVTQQLLRRGLDRLGVPSITRPLPLTQALRQRSAFLCNSGDPGRPIAEIDGSALTVDPDLTTLLTRAYETNPLDVI